MADVKNSVAKISFKADTSDVKKKTLELQERLSNEQKAFRKIHIREQEKAFLKTMSKEGKVRRRDFLKELKMKQRYQIQFMKQGLSKEEALKKAHQRSLMSERVRTELDHAEKIEALSKPKPKKKKSGGTGAGAVFTGNLMADAAIAAGNMILAKLKQAVANLDEADKRDFFKKQYGEAAFRGLGAAAVKTGVPISELTDEFKNLVNVVGKNRASGLLRTMTAIQTPLYNFKEVASDINNYLRGGSLGELSNFATQFGKGKTRQMNMLIKQQEMLVQSGLAYSMDDDNLVLQREKMINKLRPKEHYEASHALQMSRGMAEGKNNFEIDASKKVVGGMISGLTNGALSPEELAMTSTDNVVANSLNVVGNGIKNAGGFLVDQLKKVTKNLKTPEWFQSMNDSYNRQFDSR